MRRFLQITLLVAGLSVAGITHAGDAQSSDDVPLPRFDSVEAQLEAAMRTFHETDPDNWAWELELGD